MVRAILLLHYYKDSTFVGQKLQWVEVPSAGALCTLLNYLAQGFRATDLRGTEAFPTESAGYRAIRGELEMAYEDPFYTGVLRLPVDQRQAKTVRVVQVIPGWPAEVPNALR